MRIYEFEQYTPDWWAIRRGVPTASDFHNILTAAKGEPSKSQMPYICKLIADRLSWNYGEVEEHVSAAMQKGSDTEPEARKWYELERDLDVKQVGFCISDCGRFGCSPDGLIGEDGGLELKCPQPHTHVQWLIDKELPADHKQQVHGQLIVTGRKWWDFMSYAAGLPPLLVRIVPDEYTEKLRAALDPFWSLYQETFDSLGLEAMEPPRNENAELTEAEIYF